MKKKRQRNPFPLRPLVKAQKKRKAWMAGPAGAFASGGGQLLTFTEKISVAAPPGDTVLVAVPHATVDPVEE
jgi:hypothetical protein